MIETPEFMRGIYGVGGFDPAPALEPQLARFIGSRRFQGLARGADRIEAARIQ